MTTNALDAGPLPVGGGRERGVSAITSLAPGTAGDAQLTARIGDLVAEHTALGAKLARLRELTAGYTTPDDG